MPPFLAPVTRRLMIGALSAAAIGVPPTTAQAAGKPITKGTVPAASPAMRAQAPLVAAARRIKRIAAYHTGVESGLGGIRLDRARRTVEVSWKGPVPLRLHREQSRSRAARIQLTRARFTETELLGAARGLAARRSDLRGVTRIGPMPDGSGLEVGVRSFGDVRARQALSRAPVPIHYVAGQPVREATRTVDFAPYWAGALLRPAGGSNRCSTGFALVRYFFWIETRGILTARHCATTSLTFLDGAGMTIGTAETPNPPQSARFSDSLFIPTRAGARTYSGGLGSPSSAGVAGHAGSFPGQLVCTSGGATGQHCDVQVSSINNLVILMPSFTVAEGVALATERNGAVASGPGDSGGPVFMPIPSDPTRVFATGMMAGAFGATAPCPGGTEGCTTGAAFVDLGYIMTAQQAKLLIW